MSDKKIGGNDNKTKNGKTGGGISKCLFSIGSFFTGCYIAVKRFFISRKKDRNDWADPTADGNEAMSGATVVFSGVQNIGGAPRREQEPELREDELRG